MASGREVAEAQGEAGNRIYATEYNHNASLPISTMGIPKPVSGSPRLLIKGGVAVPVGRFQPANLPLGQPQPAGIKLSRHGPAGSKAPSLPVSGRAPDVATRVCYEERGSRLNSKREAKQLQRLKRTLWVLGYNPTNLRKLKPNNLVEDDLCPEREVMACGYRR